MDDTVPIDNLSYPFPSNSVIQGLTGMLSEEATTMYRNRRYCVSRLIETTLRRIQIRYISAGHIKMPIACSAFATVEDQKKVIQINLSTFPGIIIRRHVSDKFRFYFPMLSLNLRKLLSDEETL